LLNAFLNGLPDQAPLCVPQLPTFGNSATHVVVNLSAGMLMLPESSNNFGSMAKSKALLMQVYVCMNANHGDCADRQRVFDIIRDADGLSFSDQAKIKDGLFCDWMDDNSSILVESQDTMLDLLKGIANQG
jgi:hypothetical protein